MGGIGVQAKRILLVRAGIRGFFSIQLQGVVVERGGREGQYMNHLPVSHISRLGIMEEGGGEK